MFSFLVLILAVLLATVSPVAARVVRMQTTISLDDHSERSIELALRQALEAAVTTVTAMGLSSMRVDEARILPDAVVVAVIATDGEPDDDDSDN